MLGPDNQITLWAATSLDFAQFGLREAATAGATKFRLDEATAGTLGQAETR